MRMVPYAVDSAQQKQSNRDTDFKLPTGRGDEFAHGVGPDSRDRPKPIVAPRDMYVKDLRIVTFKVKSLNFQ